MGDDRRARLREVAADLGHDFEDLALLDQALTHRSAAVDLGIADNERLEFLGDAVLDLVVSRMLYEELPDEDEGHLTQVRSRLVSSAALQRIGEDAALTSHLLMSVGESRDGGRVKRSVVANTVEAVVGALYLDGGVEAARRWLLPRLRSALEELGSKVLQDPKNRLQELVQGRGMVLPEYRTVTVDGPPHRRTFVVECLISGAVAGTGSGSSKQEAQRLAAQRALEVLEK